MQEPTTAGIWYQRSCRIALHFGADRFLTTQATAGLNHRPAGVDRHLASVPIRGDQGPICDRELLNAAPGAMLVDPAPGAFNPQFVKKEWSAA